MSEFSSLINQLSDMMQISKLPQPLVSLPEKWAQWCDSMGQLEDANDLVKMQVGTSLRAGPSAR